MRLLDALAAASHPLSVSEVGDAIGVDQPRASRLIQQAVELGLVRREADPDDARRTRVALTDEGQRLARGFRQRADEIAGLIVAEGGKITYTVTLTNKDGLPIDKHGALTFILAHGIGKSFIAPGVATETAHDFIESELAGT